MVVFTINQGGFATDGDGPKEVGCVKLPKNGQDQRLFLKKLVDLFLGIA